VKLAKKPQSGGSHGGTGAVAEAPHRLRRKTKAAPPTLAQYVFNKNAADGGFSRRRWF
jgi:hypothetical protein